MPARKVTIKYVYAKALKDRRFCRALLKNPKKALAAKKFALTQDQLRRLRDYLRRKHCFTGRKLMKLMSEITPPSPKPWPD